MKKILWPPKNEQSSGAAYLPALDGLRGLAILLVIQYHIFSFPFISRFTWIGVDLFFVLSGFLITGILLRTRESKYFLKNFYGRRVLRIMPVYFLSLILLLYVIPHLFTYPFDMAYFLEHQAWFWLEVQNWLFIFKPEGNNNFLNHFWTLGLEEQFYLVSPWIIFFIKTPQKILSFLLCLILFLVAARIYVWSLHFENFSYKNLFSFTRIDGLCAGSFLAVMREKHELKLSRMNFGIAIFLASIIFLALPLYKTLSPAGIPFTACCVFPFVAVLLAIIVNETVKAQSWVHSLLRLRFMIFFGRISYGLYIFHWPVYVLLSRGQPISIGQFGFQGTELIRSIAATVISIVLATISYIGFEQYFLRLKKYFV